MKKVLKAAWEFCSFVFVPQRGKEPQGEGVTKFWNDGNNKTMNK